MFISTLNAKFDKTSGAKSVSDEVENTYVYARLVINTKQDHTKDL